MPVADFAHGVKSPFFSMVTHTNDGSRAKTVAATTTAPATGTTATTATASTNPDDKSFFDNVLDVINPLQHLPIVGPVYRAMTGDKIGDLEKVAGDTLYGGVMGLASSLADLAFEKITGKDFGDTVLGMVGIESKTAPNSKPAVLAANTNTTNVADAAESTKTAALNKASLMTPPATKIAQAATALPIQAMPLSPTQTATTAPTPVSKLAAAPATPTPNAQTVVDISPQTDALLSSLQRNGVTGAMQTQALDAYRRTMSMNAQSATVH